MALRDQAADAQKLYDSRAESYDKSWHPRFARHMVELARIQRGEQFLDLACGTGLATFCASTAVGEEGSVTGIEISSGMLAQANHKLVHHRPRNVQFCQHSITDLDSLEALQGKKFDVITCCSALVLLQDPGAAITQWTTYLKPGGRLVVDATHPQSQVARITFEKVGRRCGMPVPFYRLPFREPDDLKKMCESTGLSPVNVICMSQEDRPELDDLQAFVTDAADPRVAREYRIDEAEDIFNTHVNGLATSRLASAEVRENAKAIFKEEWAKLAEAESKIKEFDCVFVAVAYRP